jgi:hypothetical protein
MLISDCARAIFMAYGRTAIAFELLSLGGDLKRTAIQMQSAFADTQ